MSADAVRRFLTEEGWSDWINLDQVIQFPAPGEIATYNGRPILRHETKPSKRSSLVYESKPDVALGVDATSITDAMTKIGHAFAKAAPALDEYFKEQMLSALGISLNAEEPDVLTAKMLEETMREQVRHLEQERQRRQVEESYEGNNDYGQF